MKKFIFLGIIFIFGQTLMAQTNCTGNLVFTEKKCVGDEISPQEKELFKIINDYRAANNLPPITLSESLSFVANRHLLDLNNNVKTFTHGWSNCPYDIKNEKTWDCVFGAPQRLNSNYPGNGYENLYRNLGGNATPALALEAWKKSPPHNGLILNLDVWKDTKFDAFGVAISGNYASIWFGSEGGKDIVAKQTKGLGVSFEKAVQGLTSVLSIVKESSLIDSDKWVGKSADKSVTLEIFGKQEDISETTMAFSVRLEKNFQLSAKNKAVLSTFLMNLTGKWAERETWIDATVNYLSKNRKAVKTVNVQNKTIEVKINAQNNLTVLVKPFEKPKAQEFK
jgi:Cysteine-rich secretory protein family